MFRAATALLVLASFGCHDYGPEKTEPAEVINSMFVPAGHGSGTGFTTKGDVTFQSIDIPARYGVVFKCEHGQFAIHGEGARYRSLWESLPVGSPVTIRYREIFDGDKAVGLDFIDAVKR